MPCPKAGKIIHAQDWKKKNNKVTNQKMEYEALSPLDNGYVGIIITLFKL